MLEKTFKHLIKARLKIKLSKCSFFKEKIHNLGHLVSGMSILPLANKTEAFMRLKSPANIKEVRHFLRLTGFNSKIICNYADFMHPLNCLTYKSQPLIWNPECQVSFDMLHS